FGLATWRGWSSWAELRSREAWRDTRGELRQHRTIGRESERRRRRGIEPAHRLRVVARARLHARVEQPRAEPDPDGGPLRIVAVPRHLKHVADPDGHAGLLERLAGRGRSQILAPLHVAARDAPSAGAELAVRALHQEHAARRVADQRRDTYAHVGEEYEA